MEHEKRRAQVSVLFKLNYIKIFYKKSFFAYKLEPELIVAQAKNSMLFRLELGNSLRNSEL